MGSKTDENTILLLENTTKINVYGSTVSSFAENCTSEKDQHSSKTSERSKSGFIGLFRYAYKMDILLMCIGMMFSIMHGIGFPILGYVFGHMTNTFINETKQGSHIDSAVTESVQTHDTSSVSSNLSVTTYSIDSPLSPDEFAAYMTRFSIYYLFIGFGVLCSAFIQTLCWETSCERQVQRLRKIFISQILRQDISWYDLNDKGDLSTKLSDDVERIREGIGIKFSMVTQYVSTFMSGIVVGLLVNWKLTVFLLQLGPLLIGTCAYLAKITASSTSREQLKYSLAGGIADEVLSCIKTVAAFGGEKREVIRYRDALDEGRKLAMKKYYVLTAGLAFVFFCMYSSYGLAFWYGAKLIAVGYCSPGSVFTVFFSVMSGAFSLGNVLPFVNAVSTAMGAASSVLAIIDRVPNIDPYSHAGFKPKKITGHISFKNVSFSYPARQLVQVLKGLNLDMEPGKKIALVGSSGAGKSTIVNLLVRFYDVSSGVITIDGVPINKLNLHWLRNQIGVVSQEPVLFGLSIAENICCGKEHIMQDEIKKAAIIANAHGFIQYLPQGYNTILGDRGTQLSGGQKQRIAIARAIVHNPKILLLDEATSALDARNEAIVQEALEKAMLGRTTLIISHRLSTVRNADIIYVMKDGAVVEMGTHSELIAMKQQYYNLVETQAIPSEDNQYQTSEDINSTESSDTNIPTCYGRRKSSTRRSLCSDLYKKHFMKDDTENQDNDDNDVDMLQLIRLNAPEWIWLLIGLMGCAMVGLVTPVFAFFYAEIFATFTLTGDKLIGAALFWTAMFVLLGCLSALSTVLQWVGTTTACERLVMRVRLLAFTNIMCQPVGWFDQDKNSVGKLVTKLAHDAPVIKGAGGVRAGQLISSVVMLVSALVIAFIYGSKLAVVLLIAIPFIVGASYEQTMILRRSQKRGAEFLDNAGRVALECIQNVRTVQSLGKEKLFVQLYMNYLAQPFKEAKKQAVAYAILFAVSHAVIYLMYAGAFRLGAYLIEIRDMTPSQVYRVFFALAFCAASVGQGAAYIQDYAKAKAATAVMFNLIKRKSEIDVVSPYGIKPFLKGKIAFNSVYFHYPARPEVEVLQGLDFTVYPGKTLAIVGASGCGKSTVISLLERFYDPNYGTVMIDNIDISIMNLQYLRSHIGLVTQEPILFDCSIRENIIYGLENSDLMGPNTLFDHITEAAEAANIHNFIVSLPQGYETLVGKRGTQLSGGQKQRIAIARALIRDPKILLLDEATSALDTENEKIVQEALDKAKKGRTCIIIAHRLSTIQNADSIAVIHRGRIVEQGTHEFLMRKHGRYYHLVKKQ